MQEVEATADSTMAYDQRLADRIRKVLAQRRGLTEKKMFGGIAFLLHGNMCCGVVKNGLVIRIGPERYKKALSHPYARPMDFTGRPLKGFVFVSPNGYKADKALAKWVAQAVQFAMTLARK